MSVGGSSHHERRLSPELTSLVHHVELHRSGWWNQALERLVLAVVWRTPAPGDQVARSVSTALGSAVSPDKVDEIVQQQLTSGMLVQQAGGDITVAHEHAAALQAEFDAVTEADVLVQTRLVDLAVAHGVDGDPDQLWYDLEELFVLPLVQAAGARMYEVLISGRQLADSVATYHDLAKPMCEKYGESIRRLLVEFFDPTVPEVRSYALRMVNSAFVREAAGLGEDVLSALRDSRSRPDRVRVFVDTNFLFSFLGLHDNPSNESATGLVNLVARTRGSIAVDFYVLPITVDETRRVLRSIIARLTGVVPRQNIASAARDVRSNGLVAAYLEAASRYTGGVLTAQSFFGPYESDPVPILREHGVELYNQNLDHLRTDQDVIDDLLEQQQYQQEHRSQGAKPYEANLHDMVLWHFVDRSRPEVSRSPLEVGDWVVTVDYGLISFDRHKRRGVNAGVPTCLTPSSLIQLLQFWAPRTEELERALVGAMREPLLFLGFDGGSEQVTLRILKAISRFENIGDLSESSIANVLTNDALRSRLEASEAEDETDVVAVESAVVDEARRLEEELVHARAQGQSQSAEAMREIERREAEVERLLGAVQHRDETIDALKRELRELEATHETVALTSAEQKQEAERVNAELSSRIEALESGREFDCRRRAVWSVSIGAVVLAAVLFIAGVALAPRIQDLLPGRDWTSNLLVVSTGLLIWMSAVDEVTTQWEALRSTRIEGLLRPVRKAYAGLVVAIGASLIAAFVFDGLSDDSSLPINAPVVALSQDE